MQPITLLLFRRASDGQLFYATWDHNDAERKGIVVPIDCVFDLLIETIDYHARGDTIGEWWCEERTPIPDLYGATHAHL